MGAAALQRFNCVWTESQNEIPHNPWLRQCLLLCLRAGLHVDFDESRNASSPLRIIWNIPSNGMKQKNVQPGLQPFLSPACPLLWSSPSDISTAILQNQMLHFYRHCLISNVSVIKGSAWIPWRILKFSGDQNTELPSLLSPDSPEPQSPHWSSNISRVCCRSLVTYKYIYSYFIHPSCASIQLNGFSYST